MAEQLLISINYLIPVGDLERVGVAPSAHLFQLRSGHSLDICENFGPLLFGLSEPTALAMFHSCRSCEA